jgi:hypothetical protein
MVEGIVIDVCIPIAGTPATSIATTDDAEVSVTSKILNVPSSFPVGRPSHSQSSEVDTPTLIFHTLRGPVMVKALSILNEKAKMHAKMHPIRITSLFGD